LFHRVLIPFSAPSNVKVGLDYIMKNADNEVGTAWHYNRIFVLICAIRSTAPLQVVALLPTATDAGAPLNSSLQSFCLFSF
jgi:hypothetical protein